MTKNKKLIIILIIVLAIGLLVTGLIIFYNKKIASIRTGNSANTQNLPAPEFLSGAEKLNLGLAPEQKIQILGRDADGEITTYKVIKSETDIVLNPAAINPISPRQKPAVK